MKNPARAFRKVVITGVLVSLVTITAIAQKSVGIGTGTPNPNAVLELVTTGDQGLLLPRMTTAQRTATSLTSILTNTDNGLTVFDTDDGKMYFWFNGVWITSSVSLTAGAGIDLTGNVITNTGDIDPTDDLTTTSVATGDVTGDFANTVVGGLQGNPVSAVVPATGQVLKWDGVQWLPSPDDGQILTAGAGIDLTGNVITNTGDLDPSDDILRPDLPAAGDIAGSYDLGFTINNDVIGTALIQDAAVTDVKISDLALEKLQQGAANDGDFLIWNNTLLVWEPAAFSETQSLLDVLTNGGNAGDLSITEVNDVTLTGGTVTMATEATHQGNLQNLTGVGVGSDDLGALSHPVLLDNQTILDALIQLGDSVDAFSSGAFTTTGEIPVGDGTGLISSNLFSDGTNIGIGTPAPTSQLQIDDRSHLLQFTDQQGSTLTMLSHNFYPTSPTTFERNVIGTGAFMFLSDSNGFEVQKILGGPAGPIALGSDNYSIFDVDSAEFRVDGLIDASPGFINLEATQDQTIQMPTSGVVDGFEFMVQGSDGNTNGGDIVLRPGNGSSALTDGELISDGTLRLRNRSGSGGSLLFEGQTGNTVTVFGPQSSGPDYSLTLPDLPGADGEFLTYNTGGLLTWSGLSVFNNNGEIPRGDGAGQVSSNIFSNSLNVGIGTPVGTERLEVGGNIEIPVANDYQYSAAKTKQMSYHPNEFQVQLFDNGIVPELSNFNSNTRYVYYANGSGTSQAYSTATVKLPDGASISQLEAWVVDNDATLGNSFVRIDFYRSEVGVSNSRQLISTVQTTQPDASTAVVPLSTGVVSNPIIDNANYSYYLEFVANDDMAELQLHGVRISYTVTKVD